MVKITSGTKPPKQKYVVLENTHHLGSSPGHWRLEVRSPVWRPPTDVYETDEGVIIRVEIAGMDESDFSISLDGNNLSLRGVRQDVTERRAYHQLEISFGEFNVEIALPFPVNMEKVEAVYNNGFLRMVLPKAYPQQIRIDE